MGIKAEYNPSTGLMHFTAATKKVQVVDDVVDPCSNCANAFEIDVVLSTGSLCSTSGSISANRGDTLLAWTSYINATHRLSSAESESPIRPCRWTAEEDVSSLGMYLDVYANASCTNPVDTVELVVSMSKEVTLDVVNVSRVQFELTTETGRKWDTIAKQGQVLTQCYGPSPGVAHFDQVAPDPLWDLGTCFVYEVP